MVQHIEIHENSWDAQAISNEHVAGVSPNMLVYVFTDCPTINEDLLNETFLRFMSMHTVSTAQRVFFRIKIVLDPIRIFKLGMQHIEIMCQLCHVELCIFIWSHRTFRLKYVSSHLPRKIFTINMKQKNDMIFMSTVLGCFYGGQNVFRLEWCGSQTSFFQNFHIIPTYSL